jgi:hypothetical protein
VAALAPEDPGLGQLVLQALRLLLRWPLWGSIVAASGAAGAAAVIPEILRWRLVRLGLLLLLELLPELGLEQLLQLLFLLRVEAHVVHH